MKTYNNYWDQIVELMNDDIREAVHAELAPCTNTEFLERYGTGSRFSGNPGPVCP